MGWANHYIEKLQAGERVSFRPRGNSMSGKVENGQLVTLEPAAGEKSIHVGDVVLCKVNGVQSSSCSAGYRGERPAAWPL